MVSPWIAVEDLEDPTSPFAAQAIESASYILWVLSARKYSGARTVTELYCQMGLDEIGVEFPNRAVRARGMQVWPVMQNGSITNMVGGRCSTCGCPHLLKLRGSPVLSIDAMSIGGRALTADEVSIFDYSYVSVGKNRCWGSCEDVEVTYTFGTEPPTLGRRAAKELADQFVLAATGSDDCALPQRVTSVSRQGMSWTLLDPQDFLDKGLTGLYTVDLFLRTVNPTHALLKPRVFSPDVPRAKARRASGMRQAPAIRLPDAGGFSTRTSTPATPVASSLGTMLVTDPPSEQVVTYSHRPLRWVVPGAFTPDNPPVISVQPSGALMPTDALQWRGGNYTLDLTAQQTEELLPPGSVLVVASVNNDGAVTGQPGYAVERRTL